MCPVYKSISEEVLHMKPAQSWLVENACNQKINLLTN